MNAHDHVPLSPAERAELDQCEAAIRTSKAVGLGSDRWTLMHQIFDASDLLREAAKKPEAADIRHLLEEADALLSQAVDIIEF
ncbi:hypothetical protein [[Actinomadura] parvosata]|uniref:hypothetical protein n=1 Tax=[Actinomadura] parvosata TaxID=1955412 RepID=UPI0012BC572E|nr:hypothetical protein [Nonomuraea sp. ATCC 55076]